MSQRLFRSDDDSKNIVKYGTGGAGDKTYSSSHTLDSTDKFYNGTITGTAGATTGPTDLADGTYNLPCEIIQSSGVGSNASINYEFNKLLSVSGGVATFLQPFTKNWVTGAQFVTSNNWHNVTTNNAVTLDVPAYDPVTKKGGHFYMTGTGEFKQIGTGKVDLRGKGFPGGDKDPSSTNDYGGFGGYGLSGMSGKGGFSGNGGGGSINGDVPSGGGRSDGGTGASGGQNYTGGGGGAGGNSSGNDEGQGGGGGGGNKYGGGGGGDGSDGNSAGGNGGAASGLGGGNGGTAGHANGYASGSGALSNYSGAGGAGTGGAGLHGGGGGGGADANSQAELKAMHMGGGGGAGGNYNFSSNRGSDGGNGSGCSMIVFPRITLTGGVLTTGLNGQSAVSNYGGGGGGGAAGDQRYIGYYIDLGSNTNAQGGTGSSPTYGGKGGYGSEATIHADYLVSVTGTTSPAYTSRQDRTIRRIRGGSVVAAFMGM